MRWLRRAFVSVCNPNSISGNPTEYTRNDSGLNLVSEKGRLPCTNLLSHRLRFGKDMLVSKRYKRPIRPPGAEIILHYPHLPV